MIAKDFKLWLTTISATTEFQNEYKPTADFFRYMYRLIRSSDQWQANKPPNFIENKNKTVLYKVCSIKKLGKECTCVHIQAEQILGLNTNFAFL